MAQLIGEGVGDKLVMIGLVNRLRRCACLYRAGGERHPVHVVQLVKGHPVFDLMLIAAKHRLAVAGEEIDKRAVLPAAVFLKQRQRRFVVGKRNHRLNAIFQQLVEQGVVKGEARLVRRWLIAAREDTRPGNRRA